MILSKVIKRLDKLGKTKQIYPLKNHYCGPPSLTKEHSVVAHLNDSDSLLEYKNGVFSVKKLNFKEKNTKTPIILGFYKVGQNFYAVDLIRKTTFLFRDQQLSPIPFKQEAALNKTESTRIYQTTKGLWIAGTLPGVSLESNLYTHLPSTFYPDFFISDIYEDHEGNILLSTFDKGILVIPDLLINDVIAIGENETVTTINFSNANNVLLGTSKGSIYSLNQGKTALLNNFGTRSINVIESAPNGDCIIVDNGFIREINLHSKKSSDVFYASLKAVAFVDDNQFFLGTNKGVFHVNKIGRKFIVTPISDLSSRVYHIQFDKKNKILYASTSDGLFCYTKGKVEELKIAGNSLFVSGMDLSGQKLYASTRVHGLSVIENGKIISSQQFTFNRDKLTLKKIKVNQSNLIAETSDGFYQIDLKNKSIKALHYIYGFFNNRIIDFDVLDNQLWVSHSGGVQYINLNYKLKVIKNPTIRIESIKVNNKETREKDLLSLSHNQNKLKFYFSSNTIRNRGIFQYQYRLLGSDTAWQINDFNQNTVDFNSLSPGKYTFQIRIENQGEFSQIKEISFTISPAFYFRWWFITLASIVFIGIVYCISRWQWNRQKEKLKRVNELNTSKLTAIKSQMNPHFIFNSLNSIQDLILKGDVEHSYSYISTFSNLVRTTLNNSEKEFIAIEDELSLLKLYLSLEKLRFKNDFDYQIICPENLDIRIPPMLIQPFIENALVHGLLHKKGNKKIAIHFELGDFFQCIIEDNGVGRKAAQEIQKRQQRHESFSSQAIKKRFEILSHVYHGEFGFEYEDIVINNEIEGTRVTLKMPYQVKF